MASAMPRRVRQLVPHLDERMREDRCFWEGDPDSDRAQEQYRALLAVLDAVTGSEEVEPSNCWGYDLKTKRCRCKLHRAVADLRALHRRGAARRRRTR